MIPKVISNIMISTEIRATKGFQTQTFDTIWYSNIVPSVGIGTICVKTVHAAHPNSTARRNSWILRFLFREWNIFPGNQESVVGI